MTIPNRFRPLILAFMLAVMTMASPAFAQNTAPNGVTPVTLSQSTYYLTPISATAAVNTATTLTIPAAAGLYNYVCSLAYQVNNDNTATAVTNVVSTSTNFNAFAVKFSAIATASIDSGAIVVIGPGTPGAGCVKSTIAGTATTFVSPASVTHSAWTWYATYYQAP